MKGLHKMGSGLQDSDLAWLQRAPRQTSSDQNHKPQSHRGSVFQSLGAHQRGYD